VDTLLSVFVIFAVVMIGMAVGVIFSNRQIKGSCGGLNTMRDDLGRSMCECGLAPGECSGDAIPTSEEKTGSGAVVGV
tara:strand:+ start:613 stop:846 length:234 start_codon:yes stop_codon:yes gene_type:complete